MNVMRCNQDIFRGAEAHGSLSTSLSRWFLCDKAGGFLAYPTPVSLPSFGASVFHLPSGAPSALFNDFSRNKRPAHRGRGCSMVVARKGQAVRHGLTNVAHNPTEHPTQLFNLLESAKRVYSMVFQQTVLGKPYWAAVHLRSIPRAQSFNMCYGQQLCEGAANGSTLRKAACRTRSGRGFNSPRLHQN